jgi:hypothetical protein
MKDNQIITLIKKGRTEKPIQFLYKEFPKIKANILSSGGDEEIARQIFHDSLILLIEKVEKKEFLLIPIKFQNEPHTVYYIPPYV